MSFLNIRSNKNNRRYKEIRHSHNEIYKKFISVSLTTFVIILLVFSFSIVNVFAQTYPFIASTRDSFDLKTGKMIQRIDLPSALSILKRNDCPGQLAVYVHGVWATDQESKEQTDTGTFVIAEKWFSYSTYWI